MVKLKNVIVIYEYNTDRKILCSANGKSVAVTFIHKHIEEIRKEIYGK
jgi:hypothetical protein